MKKEHKKKVVIVGRFGVGKTSLIQRFVHSIFSDMYLTTIGVKIDKKTVEFQNDRIHLIIWDIAGAKQNHNISPLHLQGAHGFIYVCDLSRPSTLENLEIQISEIIKTTGNIPCLRVGNKSDLISPSKLKSIINTYSLDIISSAKHDKGVIEIFEQIAKKFI